jgi:methyl-accepting chemotaxis protein
LAIRAQIVGAVQDIREAALQLQSGDLTQRAQVFGRDEVAQSAQAFNQLVDGFQGLVRQVLEGARELSASARGLASDAHEVEHGAARQAESIEAVAASMEEMSVSIAVVADSAEQMRANSQQSLQGTQAGCLALESMRGEADRVQAAFAEIQTLVEDFLKRTAAISDLTQRVKDIAGQTNLLALNASIEAARAGDLGRGFAVVADEVRKLAEHSSGAASHIEEVTAALGARSEAVGRSLESGHQSLVSTFDQLAALQRIISDAGEAVATTTHEIDGIAAAVKEQSRGSSDVARNVDEIVRMSEKNTRVVVETAGAAAQLERLAEGLELAVAHFRV